MSLGRFLLTFAVDVAVASRQPPVKIKCAYCLNVAVPGAVEQHSLLNVQCALHFSQLGFLPNETEGRSSWYFVCRSNTTHLKEIHTCRRIPINPNSGSSVCTWWDGPWSSRTAEPLLWTRTCLFQAGWAAAITKTSEKFRNQKSQLKKNRTKSSQSQMQALMH